MKRRILYCFLFFSIPIAILILAIMHRPPKFEGKQVAVWFNEITTGQPSPALAAFQRMAGAGVAPLQNALKSEDLRDRMKAAWALGELGPIASNAIPSLIDAMDDPASNVEILAIQSLEKIAPEQVDAIPKLLSRLGDSNPGVSNSAADLLNKIEKARKARNLATYSNEYEFDMAFLHSTSQRARLFGLLRLMHFSVPDERVDSTLKALLTDTNSMIREQTAIFLKNPSMGFSDSSVPVNGGYRTGNEVR